MTLLKPQQEWELLQDLEHHPGRLPVVAARLKRKLQLRRVSLFQSRLYIFYLTSKLD
jgi:hypothetical protein